MPRFLSPGPTNSVLCALGEALDLVDFGIVLLDHDLRARFINRHFGEIWEIDPALLEAAPTFRVLLENAATRGWYSVPAAALAAYLDERESEIRAGSTPPAVIVLADGRHISFRCIACPDGGRLLTYADISEELQREALDATARVSAELRFNSEVLEEQGAYLATLAEAAEENAQRAEKARSMLEHEIAERRQLETKLRAMATTDGLTGALNRTEFLASAMREMDARKGTARRVVVLMIDVDYFKSINDRFGHAGGDRALQHLVTILRAGIRQIDLLGRLGGEEFAIALLDTPYATAKAIAERLRERVAEAQLQFGDRLARMTISVGLAIQLETDRSIEQALARADDALYHAKSGGRNRVVADQQTEAA